MCATHGYHEVKTPQLYDAELWRTSGHWFKYRDNMFVTEAEDREFGLKPMNCPGHCHLFGMQKWSYRDLPVRYSEPGLLHRNELSGTLHGLLRVRHFVQDDAHIFCTPDQALDEAKACLDMAFETYDVFGIQPHLELSTRPDERIGEDAQWDEAEALLARALEEKGLSYEVREGDGAFYGPKIDLHFRDSLGRSWQLGTVQLDFQLPERFDLTYTGADNAEHRVVMLHRALFGSYERFIGILLEDTAGELPVWLAPVQALVLPIADRHAEAAERAAQALRDAGRARRGRRAHGVRRAQDPRGRAAQGAVHARHGRPRGAGGRRRGAPPRGRGRGEPAVGRRRRAAGRRGRRAPLSAVARGDWRERLAALPAQELPGGLTVHEARGLRARRRGLAGLDDLGAAHALRIGRCRAVHTFGMRFPIDLVWLGRDGEVVRVDHDVPPRRHRSCRRAAAVVETKGGESGRFVAAGLGYTPRR